MGGSLWSVMFPFPHDVDVAPQLLVLTLAQAALATTTRARGSKVQPEQNP